MGTALGIDFGAKRIGIAISNPEQTISVPLTIIEVKPDDSHLNTISKIIDDYKVEEIVLGMPYNMDGTVGDAGNNVNEWAELLKNKFKIPIILWDERLSTFEAHNMLASINIKHKERKKVVDSLAANIILQSYIDAKK